ncbi:FAD-binding oxidoreductase [Brucella sp. NBRC 113783]|uniref:NAD(P)/FAD-dependent oxidoreductase n=1 Tax=Brucella sp. NBRC 113783 TaxID=3075478 RepID=UPI0029C04415|nr:FAD-binding oxidoreductase [Brucella sp. NBRC 113783]MDX4075575.1 FAD-binding oxidoreductase [Brucella sp. NBRC 113783]
MRHASKQRIAVIGGGIIGLAAACEALFNGASLTVIDRDRPGEKTSEGNAGGIAVTEVMPASVPGLWRKVPGWLFDPLGPLALRPTHLPRMMPWLAAFARAGSSSETQRIASALATLNSRTYDDLVPLLTKVGLVSQLIRTGSITVYESVDGLKRDRREWDLKRQHGITVQELTAAEVKDLEPELSDGLQAGVFTPQWSQVTDPKRILIGLRGWLSRQGVSFLVDDVRAITPGQSAVALTGANGESNVFNKVVIAAGVWSSRLSQQIGDHVLLESERGYNTTIASPPVSLQREVIFADKKFVVTPLTCGLRVGGAAEFGGLEARANPERSAALLKLATHYLPGLKGSSGETWNGHRPTTPDSLPVIGASPKSSRVIYAFGHGHLGLTQAATTARLVGDLLFDRPHTIDLTPFSISRFASKERRRPNDTPDVFLH